MHSWLGIVSQAKPTIMYHGLTLSSSSASDLVEETVLSVDTLTRELCALYKPNHRMENSNSFSCCPVKRTYDQSWYGGGRKTRFNPHSPANTPLFALSMDTTFFCYVCISVLLNIRLLAGQISRNYASLLVCVQHRERHSTVVNNWTIVRWLLILSRHIKFHTYRDFIHTEFQRSYRKVIFTIMQRSSKWLRGKEKKHRQQPSQ